MKTIRKVIQETTDRILDERGILAGDLSEVLADAIYTAVQERKERKGDACPLDWMTALLQLCGANPYTASPGLRAQVSDCGKALIASGAEVTDVDLFAGWWKLYTAKWTIESSHPTPKQIRDTWGKFQENPTRLVQSKVVVS